ncbi:hypothetical protein B0H13DRAFT_1851924 [Mycena leptocephala]|nr:hypothetical protein B0H13DRAFT_1851924 [Mycena leptocephala]
MTPHKVTNSKIYPTGRIEDTGHRRKFHPQTHHFFGYFIYSSVAIDHVIYAAVETALSSIVRHRQPLVSSLGRPLARDRSNPARAASLNTLPPVNSYTPVYNPVLLTTPTPSNRYHAPSRPVPPRTQIAIPEERPQMDRLLDMMQMLLNDNAELKERVSSVETTLSELQSPSPARGIAAQRGRITRSKRGAPSSRRPQVPDESDVATSQSTTTDVSMDSDIEPQRTDEDGVDLDGIDVTKKEHRALQSYVSKTFRRRRFSASPSTIIGTSAYSTRHS